MTAGVRAFGPGPGGEAVDIWTLRNTAGARVEISTLGAALVTLEAPDRHGALADVVLGFADAPAYLADTSYCGAVVGRYANRIAGARCTVDGQVLSLTANAGPHCLHGGSPGFHRRVWRALPHRDGQDLRLSLSSPDGEAGFPGALEVQADYRWTDNFVLSLTLTARTDAPTPVSLAPHPYWNLAGHAAGDILDHELTLAADRYTPVAPDLIPTGAVETVTPTPLDFQAGKPIGRDILHQALAPFGGYDHNFVPSGEGFRQLARLVDPGSGRRLSLFSDQPGLQLYTLNAKNGGPRGKDGAQYPRHGGVALEPQAFPDAPNQPAFPNAILRPGETYFTRTEFRFDAIATQT